DPVFTIPDLLIHLHKNVQSKRKTSDVMKGEEMNALIAAFPDDDGNAKEKFKLTVLRGLNRKYGITEEDFHASELSLVPVMGPRHVGIDASMIGGAGQDDGICSFAAARALGAVDGIPPSTAAIALFDKEEIGSNGPTGARSSWLHHVMNDLMLRAGIDDRSKNLNRCLEKVKVLSADVTAALDPTFKSVHDPKSAAVLGKGIAIMKYTGYGGKIGANDASGRHMAFLGEIFSRNGVPFQVTSLGAVDAGGGGTIAKYISESFNCDVVDAGPSLLNMHSPFEISHVADLHATWKGFKVFLES
ncbi:aminopeptidase, partial [Candidatus Bathyarchaeota archaeon]|nr:aminopeptidase [Candidatus Bathyarchaeota archaeon]